MFFLGDTIDDVDCAKAIGAINIYICMLTDVGDVKEV
jgi:phosphoglycolate phosphatase-like HAD superfamily hydrolase